ncbi:hypothetical protein D9611_012871 [Ephemerocybe angulata]|uniref:Uncharacterized protein n=1 Tax=Ephemerocybe angulata TaxID=980116 RepID=A0A8H5BBG9_9AGAR|nr:hypothetical protein D9611_012871 [Tulosesus angulatus]
MLFRTFPVVGLLLAGLVALASARFDYEEFDSRDSLYDARDYVDVPFQPSLRAFLEAAVDAHEYAARSLALDVDTRAPADLEARLFGKKEEVKEVLVKNDKGPSVYINVGKTDTGRQIKEKIALKLKCEATDITMVKVGRKVDSKERMKELADGATYWSFTGVDALWVDTIRLS